jgi:hypothetical protein
VRHRFILFAVYTHHGDHYPQLYSPIPTDLSNDDYHSNINKNAAIIGGSVAAGVVLLILLIGAIFLFKRAQKRRLGFIEALNKGSRENKGAGSVGLLDGEFDDDQEHVMQQYRDLPSNPPPGVIARSIMTTPSTHARSPSQQSIPGSPSLFRARASDSGSLFHEEGVWPPPAPGSRFVDPFMKSSSEIDLSNIVDGVMGENASYFNEVRHAADASTSSTTPLLSGLPAGAAPPHKPSPLVQATGAGSSTSGSGASASAGGSGESGSGHSHISQSPPWIQRTPKKSSI